jgi:hypothetical protein
MIISKHKEQVKKEEGHGRKTKYFKLFDQKQASDFNGSQISCYLSDMLCFDWFDGLHVGMAGA